MKRVYKGSIVAEGAAVFGFFSDEAPMREPVERDPLGRLSEEDYAQEEEMRLASIADQRWLKPDRIYAFPEPTHWWRAD